MTDRFPLIANPTSKQIEELASGDNLNLQSSGIVGATTITSDKFVGPLQGNATSADRLNFAENITSGTISSSRLSGYYGIDVNSANILTNAANITTGFISSERLTGDYNIDITGTAIYADNLYNAANILAGTINADRLTGTYDINVSTATTASDLTPGLYAVDISGNAATATTAINLSGGNVTGTSLNISGNSNLGLTTVTNLTVTDTATIGYSTITSASIGIVTITSASIGFLTATNSNVSGTSTVGFLTASSISTPNATIGILTATILSNIVTAGISDLTVDYIRGLEITSLNRINTGIASVGFATITNAYIGIATINQINAGIITAPSFVGNLTGTATTAINLDDAANITTGTISSSRLSGSYGIDIAGTATTAINLSNAANITTGTISSSRLSGTYGIDIAGTATTAINLDNAANITTGTISSSRLSGSYGIDIAGTATTAINVIGGIASVANLRVTGITTLGVTTVRELTSTGIVTASSFIGDGSTLSNIVTQVTAGIGISLTPTNGIGIVRVESYRPNGKTIFVSQNGNDDNTGLAVNHPKRSIKAAASIAFPGDTIKVFPGTYIEDNPIVLGKTVSIEGTELRNCVITPRYTDRDLFYVNNSVHMTNLSFIGPDMSNGSAVVSLKPLAGVSTDRFFDAARMIRLNLDFIANEAVGYLTSTDYRSPAFSAGIATQTRFISDVKTVLKSVCFDITRGGNSKCVGAGKTYYTDAGALQYIVGVKTETIAALNYAAGIARSCINNVSFAKTTGGNYQTYYTQVKDLGMQPDGAYGNQSLNGCANVVSAIYSCVGVVTTIINNGLSALGGAGIKTTYPGNLGIGFTTIIGVTSALYDNTTGNTTLIASGLSVKTGDMIEVRDLNFSCNSGGGISTQKFPSGRYGYEFYVNKTNNDGSFVINTGFSTLSHNYVDGGFVVNRSIGITTAVYNNVTGVTTITANGAYVKVGDIVTLIGLGFTCTSGPGIVTYPSGNLGYNFRVNQVIGTAGTTFVVNVGTSTLPHTYVSGGIVKPAYSSGVGPITQGPYIRNSTNFIGKSIGLKVDGFDAEPGDQDDIGVTGTMSVDSYTQYNQGGIGVSITNGGYAQLVSIFTICDDIAIYTSSGGQCDITNSNSSFGNYGLYAIGVGDNTTKSIYRYTGVAVTDATEKTNVITISGVGTNRPYDGQSCYFGTLYYNINEIRVDNGGSGYTAPPTVTISNPTGPTGVVAQATATILNGSVTAINILNSGSQYLSGAASITIAAPFGGGTTATASVSNYQPIYYKVSTATLPSSGISTVTFLQTLNNTVSAGTTVYFARGSLQLASTISFEHVGAGTNIFTAKPALGGVVIPENKVVQIDGGTVTYTSTDQSGNFNIGDGVVINQSTGQISGRDFTKALFTTVTPFILALTD